MKSKPRKFGICANCNKEKMIWSKNMCKTCYNKKGTPIIRCKYCKESKNHHAKGFCFNCYQKIDKKTYDKIKASYYKRFYRISLNLYREKTKKCIICGFDKIVDLHHLDKNHNNNDPSNLVGLCPNHHKMLHKEQYNKQIETKIQRKLLEIA